MNIKNVVEKRDILIILGLISLGMGLFLWFGIGPSLAATGAIISALGIFGGE